MRMQITFNTKMNTSNIIAIVAEQVSQCLLMLHNKAGYKPKGIICSLLVKKETCIIIHIYVNAYMHRRSSRIYIAILDS